MTVRNEISTVITKHGLSESTISEVGKLEWKSIIREVEDRYISKISHTDDLHWAWNKLKGDVHTIQMNDNFSDLKYVLEGLLKEGADYWFIVDDDSVMNKQWLYRASRDGILLVLAQSYQFEYYILPLDFDWMLVENHHNCLIGSGTIIQKMKGLIL